VLLSRVVSPSLVSDSFGELGNRCDQVKWVVPTWPGRDI